jgi:uncharacterized protein (TIGR00661 family)
VRILYGVCGEGMGHAIRSAVVGSHLRGLGHDLTYVCSFGRAFDHLKRYGGGRVIPTLGLHTALSRNRVDPVGTALGNAALQLAVGPLAHTLTAAGVGWARPDAVVSDFEPWSARYAGVSGLPLVAVDNIHFASHCRHDPKIELAGLGDAEARGVMLPVVERMVPGAKKYLVTSFVGEGVAGISLARERTSLHLPILRPETLSWPRTSGDHVVVYFNDKSDPGRLAALSGIGGVPFHVYGTGVKVVETRGNITFLPMGVGFLEDMASSRAVLAGGGFTTMTEALYLGKPLLAIPYHGQYEQALNANYLSAAGYGERADRITREGVGGFLERSDGYRSKLAGLVHDGNLALFAALAEALGA